MTTHPTQAKSMIRELTDHKVNPANDKLNVTVEDGPGAGGAHHRYSITGFDTANNPSNEDPQGYKASFSRQVILFQNGPINEVGVNGITHEALLVILIDRLRCFQSGPYNCFENACALTHLEAAQASLHSRTRARMDRGVEGTHQR
jgi:hypothetical protein